MDEKVVDYLDLIAQVAAEDRAERNTGSILPEASGGQVVDYLAVSKAWQEDRGWMDSGKKD